MDNSVTQTNGIYNEHPPKKDSKECIPYKWQYKQYPPKKKGRSRL